jgi:hypothetical protein
VTITDSSNVIPKTQHDRTVAITAAALLTLLSRYNEQPDVKEHGVFKFFLAGYAPYQGDMVATVARFEVLELREATDTVVEQFKFTQEMVTQSTLWFLVRQCIKIVPPEFLLNSDEEDLFLELLKIMGVSELSLKSTYAGLSSGK